MSNKSILAFTDRVGDFYVKQYGFAPVVGRTLGYLSVCVPAKQPINDIAEALHVSRTAVVKAIKLLEQYHLIKHDRPVGSRGSFFSFSSDGIEKNGLDVSLYHQQATLAREGLRISARLDSAQREALEKIASFGDFLAGRVPVLLDEWQEQYKKGKEEK